MKYNHIIVTGDLSLDNLKVVSPIEISGSIIESAGRMLSILSVTILKL